jgi:peptidoglycan/LPS O-acetylase OafA/YrhL
LNPAQSKDALPGLTGIRGVAALAVFLCHFQPVILTVLGFDENAGFRFIDNGFRGVDLFFVLSGFILSHVHQKDFQTITGEQLRKFYLLRFFRVYPLNTLVLLALLPIPFAVPEFVAWYRAAHISQGEYHLRDFSFAAFVQSFFLAQTWTVAKFGTWNEPAWTLSAEVVGYGAFPFLANFIVRQRSTLTLIGLAIGSLASLVILMMVAGHATNNPSGIFGVIRMAFCFFAGIAVARLFHLWAIPRKTAAITTILFTLITLLFLWLDNLGTLIVFGFAGLIFGLAYGYGPINAFMTSSPIMFLGKISFSFYMVHIIPLSLFVWVLTDRTQGLGFLTKLLALACMPVACVALAMLTYEFIEIPFQRLGRKVVRGSARADFELKEKTGT